MAVGSFSTTSTKFDVGNLNKMDLIKMNPERSQLSADMEIDVFEQDSYNPGDMPIIELVDQVQPIASRKAYLKKKY